MKRLLKEVLGDASMTQTRLAEIMGCPQSRISQLLKNSDSAYVHYKRNKITKITYRPLKTLNRKD